MNEIQQKFVLITVIFITFCVPYVSIWFVNYTLLQFAATIAINLTFFLTKVSAVVYHVFDLVLAGHKQKDPLATLVFVYLIWISITHITWSIKSVHGPLSIAWTFILDSIDTRRRAMDRLEEQMKNWIIFMAGKTQATRERQKEVGKYVTGNENVNIKELSYDKKLEKESSTLRLRKTNLESEGEREQETKKLERSEQPIINQKKLKQKLPDANEQITMDVQQMLHDRQNLKDDQQGINKNQEQLKIAPEEKARNTRATDTTTFKEIHHHEEQPNTQFYNRNKYTDNPKEGLSKDEACSTLNEIHHTGEKTTTQPHNAKAHKLKKKKPHKQMNPSMEQLQREGQICKMNCVALAIRWICKTKTEMKISGCAGQLVTIITAHAVENGKHIKQDLGHLGCGHFMERLMCLGIVKSPRDNEYVFVDVTSKELVAKKAWKKLMTMKERVCILGTRNMMGDGHVVVCDLDTRTSNNMDGKVMFYDPQAPTSVEKEYPMNLYDFVEHVIDCYGLRLYLVSLQELNTILNCYRDHLHDTEETSDNAQR